MKTNKRIFGVALAVSLVAAAGCCCLQKSDFDALQGKWTGNEVASQVQGPCTMVIKGQSLEYHGANTNEWYKGTLLLLGKSDPRRADLIVNDCPQVSYIGKTSHCIYLLDGRSLTITANEPGNFNTPATFDAAGSRHFIFQKEPAAASQ